MFLSREIDIKLCQIYKKIIYIQFCMEIVGLNRLFSANTQPEEANSYLNNIIYYIYQE